ncbi:hypothetical protein A4D02_20940 [Niastella koreensis]|uniref:Peptidase M10A and M12B matrixin and adamalysin n=3 Tax=Niastella koreensis TaxID=354356 RepID=G8TMX7_NIAKG|nr:hypothetical protein Niako_0239 [Niastella koreensis GR20-10]OQP54212.1 hypothetical protein A4D02_20940 [Niastella koreensis]
MMTVMGFMVLLACSRNTTKTQALLPQTAQAPVVKTDTTVKRTVLKPYKDVITGKAISQNGLIKVHKIEERYFFEIQDSLIDRDLLVVNRISRAAAGVRPLDGFFGYAGDEIGENVIRFTKGPNNKLFINRISYLDVSHDSSENGLLRSVINSNLQPIVASFEIKAISPNDKGTVIDVTDYINGDNDVFFFNPQVKKSCGLGGLQPDKSYTVKITSFPLNTEVRTIKTYTLGDQLLTYELNSSLVLLPGEPMTPRYFDERVGFFSRGYRNYDAQQGVRADYMITRWRLEPREEDLAKYQRGELVEPKKPIVFYIDPATPKKWVPYLIEGVNAWQRSFEKAGFKNAVYAREAPADDTCWSIDDARHNVIVYKASAIQNASGPQISDPRSGEILESHVNWYHNVQQILRDWYFVQASPNDPNGRKMIFDDSLMGQLIKMVCTHEVGHTLGLQHNFAASWSVPVDSLRSKSYVHVNGHTPSIMDYARFNYVAQPEDSIGVKDLVPRIGVYDDWAIEWGYRWLPGFRTIDDEKAYMNKWIIAQLAKDKRCFFENNSAPDPRNQAEDLGDDAVKAGSYGIRNLQRVVANLEAWTKTPNSDYTDLVKMYREVINQYNRYLNHVMFNIGHMYITQQTVEQGGPFFSYPSRQRIRSAVQFFNEQLFETPSWLNNKALIAKGSGGGIIQTLWIQERFLHGLVEPAMWNWLVFNETNQPKDKSYNYDELLSDLESGIWKELEKHESIDMYRRNVQKVYVAKLIQGVRFGKVGDMGMNDCVTIMQDHINRLYNKICAALPVYKDRESRLHLEDLRDRLKASIDVQKKELPEMPRMVSSRALNGFGDQEQGSLFNSTSLPVQGQKNKGCWEGVEVQTDMFR